MDSAARLAWIPLVGAFVGYVTNCVAIWMLFHPRRPVRLLGVRFQGLVPRRRRELAVAVGRTVAEHLVTAGDIRDVLASEDVQRAFRNTLQEHVEDLLRERTAGRSAVMARVFTDRVIRALSRAVTAEIMRAVPALLELFTERLEEHVSISDLVTERIERFEEERVEALVRQVAQRELRAIELLGGVLGLLIGLVQYALTVIIVGRSGP